MDIDFISQYCAKCSFNGGVSAGLKLITFDDVEVNNTSFATATTTGTTDVGSASVGLETGAEFGRTLSVVSSVASTTQTVTISGYDYLYQPMVETFTLSGTTAVAGKKAFFRVETIEVAAGAAQTVTVSTTGSLGVPVRVVRLLGQAKDGVNVATISTLTAPVNVTQTATTGDPRGTIAFGTITAGSSISVVAMVDDTVFTIDNEEVGGLHGIPQYFA